jgi:hypothetical protein
MKNSTIKEAIIQVLKNSKTPLTSKEITQKIIEENLYKFNTDSPTSIVDQTIRRSCDGVDIKASKEAKVFSLAENKKYKLKD